MNLARSTALLLLATGAPAQDVEPTPERAIRSLVRSSCPSCRIASRTARRSRSRRSLVRQEGRRGVRVRPARGRVPDPGGSGRSRRPDGSVPGLDPRGRVARLDQGRGGRPGRRTLLRPCGLGRPAARPRNDPALGGPRDSVEAALSSARQKLEEELRRRFPGLAGNPDFERYASRQQTTTFVARHDVAGRPHYEAYLMAAPSFDRLQRAEGAMLRAEQRVPGSRPPCSRYPPACCSASTCAPTSARAAGGRGACASSLVLCSQLCLWGFGVSRCDGPHGAKQVAGQGPALDWEGFFKAFREPDFISGYEILNKLGGGVFGDVYKARRPRSASSTRSSS